jgi:hypothetical protein
MPPLAALLILVLAAQLIAVSHDGCRIPGGGGESTPASGTDSIRAQNAATPSSVNPAAAQTISASTQTQAGRVMARVNPVLCRDPAVVKDIIGVIEPGPDGKPAYRLSPTFENAKATHQAAVEAPQEKAIKDADAELTQARRLQDLSAIDNSPAGPAANSDKRSSDKRNPNKSNPRGGARTTSDTPAAPPVNVDAEKKRAKAIMNVAKAESKLDEAKKKLAETQAAAAAEKKSATDIVLLREGQARALWFGGYGLSLAVALGAIFAMAWIGATVLDDHWRPSGLITSEWKGERIGWCLLLAFGSLIVSITIVWAGYSATRFLLFSKFNVPSLTGLVPELLRDNDSLRSSHFAFDTDRTVSLVNTLNYAVIAAIGFIAAAVTMVLYQHPEQVKSRKENIREERNDAQNSDHYDQFLARCFRRLSVAIYFGGIFLVVCVARIGAEYGWLSAWLDPGATDEPSKPLPGALRALTDQLTFTYGVTFTLMLIGLYLPAWIVLRRRAWEVVRTRRSNDTPDKRTLRSEEEW